jgi:hypothetical protein
LDASANDAVKRTSKAVKEENQLNGDDRGKPGTPEKPVPADGSVITAVNKQIDDIERQLTDRRGY